MGEHSINLPVVLTGELSVGALAVVAVQLVSSCRK